MSFAIQRSGTDEPTPWPEVPPAIATARDAFRRDLAGLLLEYRGQWVAYHGCRRLGFSQSQRALYQSCVERGLPLKEILVCSVEPDEPIVIDELPAR